MVCNFAIEATSHWPTLLCVPAHDERFAVRAPLCSADAVILDVKESVPSPSKPAAPRNLAVLCTNCVDIWP